MYVYGTRSYYENRARVLYVRIVGWVSERVGRCVAASMGRVGID